jgi:similar to stage IV sporulation protein
MTGTRLLGLGGFASVKITGACPEDCLYRMASAGIRFRDYCKTDELTAVLTIPCSRLREAEHCAKKTMCTLEVRRISGLLPTLRAMGVRVWYLALLFGMVLLALWLQGHIWFFRVTGNETVPTEKILYALEENGIGFFTDISELDMNQVKNELLTALPELGFLTINTQGGVATVLVRERAEKPVIQNSAAPANIVARKNALITEVITTGGTAQVKAGDIVIEGQLLISGVTNLDKTLLLSRAEGEVYGRTWTNLAAVLPDSETKKVYTGEKTRKISLTFGKNTINFYKTSGISYPNYDKMTVRKTLTLPGGYVLPVSLTVTTFRAYDLVELPLEETQAEARLLASVQRQMQQMLTAGVVASELLNLEAEDSLYRLSGVVECQEEIGKVVEIQD